MQAVVGTQALWIALAAPSLAAWSYLSEQQPHTDLGRRYAWTLLALAGFTGLAGQALRLRPLDALAAALDGYALATLAGLRQRRGAVSPLLLNLLFACSLPAERVIQRLLGLGLQLPAPG